MMRRAGIVVLSLLLAGCAGSGGWTKPGADAATVAGAYQECLALTDTATKTDFDIDQDIGATRSSDLQHSDFARSQMHDTHEDNRDRAGAILASCMEAKGFIRK